MENPWVEVLGIIQRYILYIHVLRVNDTINGSELLYNITNGGYNVVWINNTK